MKVARFVGSTGQRERGGLSSEERRNKDKDNDDKANMTPEKGNSRPSCLCLHTAQNLTSTLSQRRGCQFSLRFLQTCKPSYLQQDITLVKWLKKKNCLGKGGGSAHMTLLGRSG